MGGRTKEAAIKGHPLHEMFAEQLEKILDVDQAGLPALQRTRAQRRRTSGADQHPRAVRHGWAWMQEEDIKP